jgi:hypothetical protein
MAEPKERRKTPRKAATPKPDTAKAEKAAAAPRKPTLEQSTEHSPEELRRQIEEAAYYRAKQRGFTPGHELDDWIQAESEVLRNTGR